MWEQIKSLCEKYKNHMLIALFASIVTVLLIAAYSDYQDGQIKEMSYNDFIKQVKENKIDTVFYNKTSEYMKVTLLNKDTKKMSRKERDKYNYKIKDIRHVLYPGYTNFRKDMLKYNVNIRLMSNIGLEDYLSLFISFILPTIWIIMLFKMFKMQAGGFGESSMIQTSNVKFDDVIGQDEVLDDIRFIAKLIKEPNISDDIGAKVPKGVLLTGAPGTGKTLIAKAIAGEAGVPFISISGSDFKEMFVGVGAKRVRDLFKLARKNAPCIIFIDEIDSIGAKRDSTKSNSEDDQTINALLKEMDGFNGREGIFILAATNYPDHLDKALIRSGRFDRQIAINPPRNWEVRKQLFEHYLNDYKLSDDVDIDTLSKTVSGFTGADIAMVCNEAGIVAMMHDKKVIDNDCLEEAIDKKVFNGNRSKAESFKKDKEIIAYHEAGHATMTYLVNQEIARASIIGTTSGVGGAVFKQDKDSCFMTDTEMKDHIMIAYAGRASEEIKFDSVTTGASNDITQATQLLSNYVRRYGFDKSFGLLDMDLLSQQSLITQNEMTERLSDMSKKLYKSTVKLLEIHYELVEGLAQKLLEVETLSGNDILKLFKEIESAK